MPTLELCPYCGKGERISATAQIRDYQWEDPYCGVCGRNWPKPKNPDPMDVKQRQSGDQ